MRSRFSSAIAARNNSAQNTVAIAFGWHRILGPSVNRPHSAMATNRWKDKREDAWRRVKWEDACIYSYNSFKHMRVRNQAGAIFHGQNVLGRADVSQPGALVDPPEKGKKKHIITLDHKKTGKSKKL